MVNWGKSCVVLAWTALRTATSKCLGCVRGMGDVWSPGKPQIIAQGYSRPKKHLHPDTFIFKAPWASQGNECSSRHISHLVVPSASLVHTGFPPMKAKLHLLSVTSLLKEWGEGRQAGHKCFDCSLHLYRHITHIVFPACHFSVKTHLPSIPALSWSPLIRTSFI